MDNFNAFGKALILIGFAIGFAIGEGIEDAVAAPLVNFGSPGQIVRQAPIVTPPALPEGVISPGQVIPHVQVPRPVLPDFHAPMIPQRPMLPPRVMQVPLAG